MRRVDVLLERVFWFIFVFFECLIYEIMVVMMFCISWVLVKYGKIWRVDYILLKLSDVSLYLKCYFKSVLLICINFECKFFENFVIFWIILFNIKEFLNFLRKIKCDEFISKVLFM